MKTADLTGAVRRFGRRALYPALPRVQAGFRTIYRQCQPASIVRSLPALPKLPKLSVPQISVPRISVPRIPWPRKTLAIDWAAALAPRKFSPRFPRLRTPAWLSVSSLTSRVKLPSWTMPRMSPRGSQAITSWSQDLLALFPTESPAALAHRAWDRIPAIHLPNPANLFARLLPRTRRGTTQINTIEWMELSAFTAGVGVGALLARLPRLRKRRKSAKSKSKKPNMLVAIDSPLSEAILLEPVLRSMREHYRDRLLHLWAPADVCRLYSAAPYIAHLRELEDRHDITRLASGRRVSSLWNLGIGVGRTRFTIAILDVTGNRIARACLARAVGADAVCILDHQGNAREQIQPSGRLVRHMPYSNKSDPSESLALLAEQWRARILGDVPRVYAGDTETQLAYSRARSWRSQAMTLGATSLVGIAPCAHPPDVSIALGVWVNAARELWRRHKALAVIFAEGIDADAIEQLSSLLGEVPHARVSTDMDALERASLLSRVDVLIGSAGAAAQIALAQNVPSIIVGSPVRKRFYTWAADHSIYLNPDNAGRLNIADLLRAYRRLTASGLPQRVAI